jgi:hypothetical protein
VPDISGTEDPRAGFGEAVEPAEPASEDEPIVVRGRNGASLMRGFQTQAPGRFVVARTGSYGLCDIRHGRIADC